jgi:hypothetical protein
MLAEIFLLRLEFAIRAAEEADAAAIPRFVPLARGMKPQFKKKPAAV